MSVGRGEGPGCGIVRCRDLAQGEMYKCKAGALGWNNLIDEEWSGIRLGCVWFCVSAFLRFCFLVFGLQEDMEVTWYSVHHKYTFPDTGYLFPT